MTSLRFKTLLMLIVGLICLVPIHAYGYTMQDVQDYLEANPATNGCNNSTEEYVTNSQTGVKVWRKCPEFPDRVKYADSWYYGGNCRTYDTTEKVILCDGEGRQGMPVYGYSNNVCEARTSWARAVKCNGTVIESYQGPVSYPVVAESCYFSHSELSDCGKEINTLLADFYPITECTDADQDGFDAYNAQKCARGNDCNDSNADINPNSMWYKDIDGDSYTDGITTGPQCQRPSGYKLASELISLGNDCDDTKAQYNPAHTCCDLKVDSFTGTNTLLDPSSGGTVALNGSISDSSGKPITWTVAIAGRSYEGTGTSVSVIWDGLDPYGKVVEPGEYTATLNAKTDDGSCTDTKTINFKVLPPPPNSCGRYVQFGSSADTASGNLSHTQELFTTKGAGLTANMTLYYNSLDSNNGPLGKSWSHNYDISVKENSNGDVVLKEGNWKRKLYESNNGSYMSQPGDYSSLTKNPDSTFTITHKDGTRYSFNQDGKIASIQDRNGNVLAFAYTNGNLTTITDSAARTTALTYETNDKIATINDSNGNTHTLTYGGNDLIGVSTQPGGSQSAPTSWSYTYFANSFMQSKTDPNGYTTTYTYDSNHRVATSTDPEGKVRSITYPTPDDTSQTKTTTFTEKDGWVWTYIFDTQTGTLTSKTDPQNGTTSYTYDANRNMASKTEPDGSITSYTYDINGNMTSQTDAMGQTTTYTYNGFGQTTSISAPDNTTTSYEYDAKGNLTQTKDAAGQITTYSYDSAGNVTQITNAQGQTTKFTYDQNNNLASVTDPAGATSSFTYDAAGNMTSQTDASGNITRFEYNSLGRLIKVVDPSGNATNSTYDANGNKTSETDANGNTTYYEYNYKGQLIKVTDALGNVTTCTYGGTGCSSCGGGTDKLTVITDANGNATKYEYDRLGRLTKETDPLGNAISYSYDAKGNLISKTDANGATITYTYDSLGRLLKKSYPDNTAESFTYDLKGNILTATNGNISYTFTYNTIGKIISATDTSGRTLNYQYDNLGNKTKTTYPEGVVNYSYDTANRLSSIINGGGRTYTYQYDSLGRRSKLTHPNGVQTTYAYDTTGRLTNLITRNSKLETLNTFTYTHDKVGNRLTRATPGNTATYSYDKDYRVTAATYTNSGPTKIQNEAYSYDPAGNRLTSSPNRTYTYNQGNQLINYKGKAYIYDKNGNLIIKTDEDYDLDLEIEGWIYSYDYENRLTKVQKKENNETKTITFKYDPFGRRIEKRIESIDKGVTETSLQTYVYDNEDIILEYRTKTTNGATTTETIKYVHGPGIDAPIAMTDSTGTYYYHADGLGSITAMTDTTGKLVQAYEYDSFGNVHDNMNAIKQPYTYTGREWDKETGLFYYRARYYDSMAGRFTSFDPVLHPGDGPRAKSSCSKSSGYPSFEGLLTNPQKLNPFTYVENNSTNLTDPKGLQSGCKDCFQVFLDCMADTLIAPGWSNFTMGAGEVAGYWYTAKAWQHAASRGLTYPKKSYIVRGLLQRGAQLPGVALLGTFVIAEGMCLNEEIKCINNQ